jgi:hypothetical protein
MTYARIDLSKTNYDKLEDGTWGFIEYPDVDQLTDIYQTYCRYKRFKSVMPIFASEYSDPSNELIGYMHNDKLVAFSLIKKFDSENAECVQFAWDYVNPELRLGINSLKHECAVFKQWGYKYLYLGGADEYKKHFDGFEILGSL